MALWTRIANLLHRDRLTREIDEELRSHLSEAIDHGRDPAEARRALGSVLHHREHSRDIRLIPWFESLLADSVFGWRQLFKRKTTSAAAVLSLALAIGACVAAFRLMDAILWRPLPIAAPERLYALSQEYVGADGKVSSGDNCAYPMFRAMRAAVKDQAELIAISIAHHIDLTYGSDQETEKAWQQYVSGWMFQSFGIRPAIGRVFSESDDLTPGAHPYAVLSYDYWQRRFAADPKAVGRTFRIGNDIFQIVGVAAPPFVGTEPGRVTDIFLPTMMAKNNAIVRLDYSWFRTFVQLRPGVSAARVLEKLRPPYHAYLEARFATAHGLPKRQQDAFLNQKLAMNPASSGISGMQRYYRTALSVLGVLVLLVLLIACANVANLTTAQAAARQREMALRVAIGAGRGRLIQLVVVECAWLACLATALGACFAWWAAPFVVGRLDTPETPTHLILPADWRVLGFAAAIALACTILFGLAPALRAASVAPVSALKGGSPHARPRIMQLLVAAQVAFCVLVVFLAGLFMTTASRLSHQPLGFSPDRLLTLETVTRQPQSVSLWNQVADHLRSVPGVESVALCEWPLLVGDSWGGLVSVNSAPPNQMTSYFLAVSPEWRNIMRIPLLEGRDLQTGDTQPGTALVNRAFVRQYLGTESAVGKIFDMVTVAGRRTPYRIVGVTGDARYRDLREAMRPTAYFPLAPKYTSANFIVRTAGPNPSGLASVLRQEVVRADAAFRVSNIRTQAALVEQNAGREQLLAMLAQFFGVVALLLAGVGLYGVLDYSVLQRRREIGIRIAVGARPAHIVRGVTRSIFTMVLTGLVAGMGLGVASVRFIQTLLFEVKATTPGSLVLPALTILCVALLAALPAVVRAVRIQPSAMLRSE